MVQEYSGVKYDICITGGCGHVGLPLGIAFADSGLTVSLYDIDKTALETVGKGEMPFIESGAGELLEKTLGKTLITSGDPSVISESKFVIVVIGTPVDEHLNPRLTLMKDFLESIMPNLRDGQHIILRSTVFPGTTEIVDTFLKERGFKVNVTFCPERLAQGKAIQELKTLPQIVSGFEDKAVEEVSNLFKNLSDDIIILRPIEAELAKLFTNTWRYIQFAIANQFYMIADGYGLDFYRVYDAITYKYPRAGGFPPAGFAAGPCLFKDTMQVAAFNNNAFFLGHAAMLVNEGLPNFIVENLKRSHHLKDKSVGILGMAFKADSDDRRESLSYKLKKILEIEAREVLCSDVYIRDEGFIDAEQLVKKADVVILGAPHKEYASLVIENSKLVDVWNFYGKRGRTE
jgi:UDP-N-acetyl-D-mannosaminuronic acid dehydrogenase